MVFAVAIRTVARRQRSLKRRPAAAHSFNRNALPSRRNQRLMVVLVRCLPGRTSTMRWKIHRGGHGHDPRRIDLLTALALVVVIIAASYYFDRPKPPVTGAFIEPSQTVRW
jgi:hypothetical protein